MGRCPYRIRVDCRWIFWHSAEPLTAVEVSRCSPWGTVTTMTVLENLRAVGALVAAFAPRHRADECPDKLYALPEDAHLLTLAVEG
jgi:hypothetical protein